jgi:hypothetical protein
MAWQCTPINHRAIILGFVTAAIVIMGLFFVLFVGAYAHAEIRTLNQIHCQPAGEREDYLLKRRKKYGYEEDDKVEDTGRFYGGGG